MFAGILATKQQILAKYFRSIVFEKTSQWLPKTEERRSRRLKKENVNRFFKKTD